MSLTDDERRALQRAFEAVLRRRYPGLDITVYRPAPARKDRR